MVQQSGFPETERARGCAPAVTLAAETAYGRWSWGGAQPLKGEPGGRGGGLESQRTLQMHPGFWVPAPHVSQDEAKIELGIVVIGMPPGGLGQQSDRSPNRDPTARGRPRDRPRPPGLPDGIGAFAGNAESFRLCAPRFAGW